MQREVFLVGSKTGMNLIISGSVTNFTKRDCPKCLQKWDIEHGTIREVVTSHDLEVRATLEYS